MSIISFNDHEGMIAILLGKFLSVINNFDLNVSARDIINRIIIEIFQIQLSNIVTNIRIRDTNYLMEQKEHKNGKIDYSQYYSFFKYDPLDYIDKLRFPFSSPVREIVEKMMICYLNLLKPSRKIIKRKIKDMEDGVKNARDYEIDESDIAKEELRIRLRSLVNTYNNYLNSN